MANVLIPRIAILTCIFLGGLLAIVATAGKEWEKIEIRVNRDTSPYYDYYYVRNWEEYKTEYKTGLWEYCRKEGHDLGAARYRCFSVNDLLRNYKISMKGNYFFI